MAEQSAGKILSVCVKDHKTERCAANRWTVTTNKTSC